MKPQKLRKAVLIALAVVIVLSVGYALIRSRDTPTVSPVETGALQSLQNTAPSQMPQQAPAPQPTAGRYIIYSDAVFAQTSGKRVLFFHAEWCPQCRALEKSVQQGVLATGLTVFKVNYDTAQELRQKYGITIQTTLVQVDEHGELIKKYVAYDEPSITSVNREFGN